MSSLDIYIERWLDTTPTEAFDAWVDNDARRQWYAMPDGATVEVENDFVVGGRWRVAFGLPEQIYVESGVYREIDRPNRIVYTQDFRAPDGSGFETLITVTFAAHGDKTHFLLVDAGFPDEQSRTAHQNGWPSFLDRYEQVLATKS